MLQRTRELPLMDTASVMTTVCSVAAAVLAARACTLAKAYSLVPSLASKVLPGSQSNWQQPVMLWWPGTHVLQRTRKPPLMDTASVTMTPTCSVAAAVLAA